MFDAAVGDIAIVSHRHKLVDFLHPWSDAGIHIMCFKSSKGLVHASPEDEDGDPDIQAAIELVEHDPNNNTNIHAAHDANDIVPDIPAARTAHDEQDHGGIKYQHTSFTMKDITIGKPCIS
ncbi:hypothetical protein FRX31_013239 [Thalictrum thalictroides]|uniref:Uncharacterized protein n=1 Tax=Thalictrum thalictroides TaxID=46969 RepID=A0A7J6WID5_THATH|nr:hypothetical protein FRX31_013239 [Thalictrum thalictroides]